MLNVSLYNTVHFQGNRNFDPFDTTHAVDDKLFVINMLAFLFISFINMYW